MRHYDLWIQKYNERREQIIGILEAYKSRINEIKETIKADDIILPISKKKPSLKHAMCFVDGGEGMRELMGAGVYLIRASGLVLENNGTKKKEEFTRDLDMGVIGYDDNTKERLEFLREAMEFSVARKCVEKYKPKYLFLDGSLYVKHSLKPIKCQEHTQYRKNMAALFDTCRDKGTSVVGVSEDSKSRLMRQYLTTKYGVLFPPLMTDPTILELISQRPIYRTIEFTPHSKETSFPTAYLKPTPLAPPLRVDVASWEQNFDEVLSVLCALSKGSKAFGYPLPLYIVHMDAKIHKKHSEWSTTQLINYALKHSPELGKAILSERRHDMRPL